MAILLFAGQKMAFKGVNFAFATTIFAFKRENYEKFVKYMVKPLAFFLNMDIIRIVISTRIYRVLTIMFALTFLHKKGVFKNVETVS